MGILYPSFLINNSLSQVFLWLMASYHLHLCLFSNVNFTVKPFLNIQFIFAPSSTPKSRNWKQRCLHLIKGVENLCPQKYLHIEACVCIPQSCLTLCHPVDYSPPGSFVNGIIQVKVLEWVDIPFSRESSPRRFKPGFKGSNLGFLFCRQSLYCLHQGTPYRSLASLFIIAQTWSNQNVLQ